MGHRVAEALEPLEGDLLSRPNVLDEAGEGSALGTKHLDDEDVGLAPLPFPFHAAAGRRSYRRFPARRQPR
jgi:hypothetical protein